MGFEFRVLKERRQWALSSVSGPPCFGLCSCFARFFKNHNKKKTKKNQKKGWFIGSEVTPSRLFFSTFDLQKGQALPGPPKKGLRQLCYYPNLGF